jgi:hypothetical protein
MCTHNPSQSVQRLGTRLMRLLLIVSRAALVYTILMLDNNGNPTYGWVNLMPIIFATAKLLVCFTGYPTALIRKI